MKRILAILLFLSIFLQSTSKIWVLGGFYLNRDYIAENFCINRFDRIPVCKGSCYLETKLQQDQERQDKSASGINKGKELVLYMEFTAPFPAIQLQFPTPAERKEIHYCAFFPSSITTPVFHPPASMA